MLTLDLWMIILLGIFIVLNTILNRYWGIRLGIVSTLQMLENEKIITCLDTGEILPYKE